MQTAALKPPPNKSTLPPQTKNPRWPSGMEIATSRIKPRCHGGFRADRPPDSDRDPFPVKIAWRHAPAVTCSVQRNGEQQHRRLQGLEVVPLRRDCDEVTCPKLGLQFAGVQPDMSM